MCGLYGIIYHGTTRTRKSVNVSAELFTRLAIHSAERGTDATGLARIDSDGYVAEYKNCLPSYEVARFKRWWRPLLNISPATVGVLGHTRFGTHGANTLDNAHPFVYKTPQGMFVGTHNGVIGNHEVFGPTPALDNDSANLFYRLATWKLERGVQSWVDTLQDVRGSFALAFAYNSKIYLAKNSGSPCYTSYIPSLHATAYASTYQILRHALAESDLNGAHPTSIDTGVVYEFELGRSVATLTRFEQPSTTRYGHGWHGGWSPQPEYYGQRELQYDLRNTEWSDDDGEQVLCDRCGQPEFARLAREVDGTNALLCVECQRDAHGYHLWNEEVQCSQCGMLTPLSDMVEETAGGEFVCKTCEGEAGAAPQDNSVVTCSQCKREFPESAIGEHIDYFDAADGHLCITCFMGETEDPADELVDCA